MTAVQLPRAITAGSVPVHQGQTASRKSTEQRRAFHPNSEHHACPRSYAAQDQADQAAGSNTQSRQTAQPYRIPKEQMHGE